MVGARRASVCSNCSSMGVGKTPCSSSLERFKLADASELPYTPNWQTTVNGGASVWHAQNLDGFDPLPDQDTGSGEYRDEFARVGVQHKANDEPHWHETIDRGDKGIESPYLPANSEQYGPLQFLLSREKIPRPGRSNRNKPGSNPKTGLLTQHYHVTGRGYRVITRPRP